MPAERAAPEVSAELAELALRTACRGGGGGGGGGTAAPATAASVELAAPVVPAASGGVGGAGGAAASADGELFEHVGDERGDRCTHRTADAMTGDATASACVNASLPEPRPHGLDARWPAASPSWRRQVAVLRAMAPAASDGSAGT